MRSGPGGFSKMLRRMGTHESPHVQTALSDCWRSSRRPGLFLAGLCFLLLSGSTTAPMAAQSTASPSSEVSDEIAPYLTPQRMVQVGKDRAINLICRGQGSPTVVLTPGLGGWSQVWYRIQGPVSRKTRVCAWDPAGLGFSDPSPEPQDTFNEAADLASVLTAAGIDGPYVMVGHSAGGFVAVRFADEHPNAVAGMVLVDPSIPDQSAIRERIAPKFAALGNGPAAEAEHLRQCAAKLKSGALKKGTPGFDDCTAQPMPDEFSRVSESVSQLNANPARLMTQASALDNAVSENARKMINPHRNYGDMPLIVLTSGQHPIPPSMPADVAQQAAVYFQALASGHKAYAALSTRGQERSVPDSGHFIQFDDPSAVLAAIDSVLANKQ